MQDLLRDTRVQRLLVANTLGSIGSGVTVFAVPWLLVQESDGNVAFRWTTVVTTLALFAIMPHYGAWVDRHSRKTALLASEVWGLLATSAMAGWILWRGAFGTWELMITYFAGMLYYTLHYPAKFAMIQQMFDRSQYQSLIGLLEIQGQTAMMIAGGLGALLVREMPFWGILLLDAATYLVSFVIQATLPYEATHLRSRATAGRTAPVPAADSVWVSVVEGWRWLIARPRLATFFTCSLIPFIIVMAGNYLFPIYVSQTLNADVWWFGAGEILFAVGAICAGAILPRLIAQHAAAATIPATMLIFLGGLIVVILLPYRLAFLAAVVLMGFGHAGCRVARSALMLNVIPNEVMGRVGGFYQVFDRAARTLLVMAMAVIDYYGPRSGYLLCLVVLLFALYGIARTRESVRPATSPAPIPA